MTDQIQIQLNRLKDKNGRVHLYFKHQHETLCGRHNTDIRDSRNGWYTDDLPDCWACEASLLQHLTWKRDQVFNYTTPWERPEPEEAS